MLVNDDVGAAAPSEADPEGPPAVVDPPPLGEPAGPERVTTPPSIVVTTVTPAALTVVSTAPDVRVTRVMPAAFEDVSTAPGVRTTGLEKLIGLGPRGADVVGPAVLATGTVVLLPGTGVAGTAVELDWEFGCGRGVAGTVLRVLGSTGFGSTVDGLIGV